MFCWGRARLVAVREGVRVRADRLLSALLLLQVHRRMTARELATRLEVSERTIHRDMEALSAAGVPVYAERGAHGGWVLPDDYRTQVTRLTESEIHALFLGRQGRLVDDLGLNDAARAAQVKLQAAISSSLQRGAALVSERIYIDVPSWRAKPEPVPALPPLQQAIFAGQKVCMEYGRSDGSSVDRVVDPLGLVAKGSTWYLAAATEGQVRSYRVSRVRRVNLLPETFERPDDFNLADWWAKNTAEFVAGLPRYPVTLHAAPEVYRFLANPGNWAVVEHATEPDANGWHELAVAFETEQLASGTILAFGDRARVLEPPELRERLVRQAAEVISMYTYKNS